MKIFQKFRNRLLVYLLLMVVIPLGVTAAVSWVNTRNEVTDSVYEINGLVAEGLVRTIATSLDSIEATMMAVSKSEQLTGMSPEAMDSILTEEVAAQSLISQMYVTDTSGMQIYKTSGELGDRSTRGYFLKAVKGEANYSDVIISGSTGKPIVVYAVPVYDGTVVVGTLGCSIDLTFLSELANSVKVGENGYSFVVDGNGITIAHRDITMVESQTDLSELKPVQDVKDGITSASEYTFDGERKMSAYSVVQNTGWGVVAQQPYDEAFQGLRTIQNILLAVLVASIVIATIVSIVLAKFIVRPLLVIEDEMAKAKQGNLRISLPEKVLKRRDEFGGLARNINDTVATLAGIIEDVKTVSGEVNVTSEKLGNLAAQTQSISNEITNAVDEIAQGASEQARDSERGSELTGAFEGKFKILMEKSHHMNGEVDRVNTINSESIDKMAKLKATTDVSRQSTEQVSQSITELEEKSTAISEFLSAITSISEQTNLLALNASIEAARAGEHGRGFAVVAEEIRKLAEGSGEAAGEIGEIIKMIETEIKKVVEMMAVLNSAASEQALSVDEVNVAFSNISQTVSGIASEITDINDFVTGLRQDNENIVDAISNISSVSEETAAGSEEVSASVVEQYESVESVSREADSLRALAEKLQEEIDIFTV